MTKELYNLALETLLSISNSKNVKQELSFLLPLLFPPHKVRGNDVSLEEKNISCTFYTREFVKQNMGVYIKSPLSLLKSLSTIYDFDFEVLKYRESKATVIRITRLPESLLNLKQEIYSTMPKNTKLTSLLTTSGKPTTPVKIFNAVEVDEDKVLKNLNTYKKHYYTLNDSAVGTVYNKVEEDIANGLISVQNADLVFNTLFYMKSMPQPKYQKVSDSPRYYAFNQSPAALPREYRKLYAKEMKWASFDLKCAQYFIAVKILNLDTTIADRVAAGESLWTILGDKMDNKLEKTNLKTALYALLFGASGKENGGRDKVIIKEWQSEGVTNAEELFKEFLSIPEINELVEKRDARIKELATARFVNTVLGTTYYSPSGASLLAYEIQSYEVALMKPLLSYVFDSTRYEVALFLHDGVYIHCAYKDMYDGLFTSLQRILAKTAKKLDVTAILEREF